MYVVRYTRAIMNPKTRELIVTLVQIESDEAYDTREAMEMPWIGGGLWRCHSIKVR